MRKLKRTIEAVFVFLRSAEAHHAVIQIAALVILVSDLVYFVQNLHK